MAKCAIWGWKFDGTWWDQRTGKEKLCWINKNELQLWAGQSLNLSLTQLKHGWRQHAAPYFRIKAIKMAWTAATGFRVQLLRPDSTRCVGWWKCHKVRTPLTKVMLLPVRAFGLNLLLAILVWRPQQACSYIRLVPSFLFKTQSRYAGLYPYFQRELEVVKFDPWETNFWSE